MDYKLAENGPAPLPWDAYAPIVRKEWQQLLGKTESAERDFHDFLEQHPCMIPGHDAFTEAGGWNNPAGPINGFVISKPLLPGISNRFPDFMWAPTDSQTQWVVLVEIEDPKKPWFTKTGQRSAPLTQAEDQIAQWRIFFKSPANLQLFIELYDIPNTRPIEFVYCLVYGRRANVSSRAAAAKRNSLRGDHHDVKWMTYDRLRPHEDARDFPCVKVSTNRELTAISFLPTTELNLWNVNSWKEVRGKGAAVLASRHFTSERQKFLASRLDYWDDLLASGLSISPSDYSRGE